MDFFKNIIELLNKYYRQDEYLNKIIYALSNYFQYIADNINTLKDNFFFDTLDENGCNYFEKILNIKPLFGAVIDSRRKEISAKWLSSRHNCLELLKKIVKRYFENASIDFIDSKLTLHLDAQQIQESKALTNALFEVKPAHLGLYENFETSKIANLYLAPFCVVEEEILIMPYMGKALTFNDFYSSFSNTLWADTKDTNNNENTGYWSFTK